MAIHAAGAACNCLLVLRDNQHVVVDVEQDKPLACRFLQILACAKSDFNLNQSSPVLCRAQMMHSHEPMEGHSPI